AHLGVGRVVALRASVVAGIAAAPCGKHRRSEQRCGRRTKVSEPSCHALRAPLAWFDLVHLREQLARGPPGLREHLLLVDAYTASVLDYDLAVDEDRAHSSRAGRRDERPDRVHRWLSLRQVAPPDHEIRPLAHL